MATKASKPPIPWVRFVKDQKTGTILMSRRDLGSQSHQLQFPRPGDGGEKQARLIFEGDDPADENGGVYLDYQDVQWLAQALPELMNEMERVGAEDW